MAGHAQVAALVGAAAAILVVVTGALGSGFSALAIPFMLWALLPYAALYFAARLIPNPWVIGGAGLAALAVEAGIRAAVFLFPRGSTAAIALVFSPVLIAVVAMPAGAIAGWIFGSVFSRTGIAVRAALVTVAMAILALTFIAFARPELFPTRVVARQQHLADIGDARIVLGEERYARTAVSDAGGWHVAGDFDDRPGEDLAIVDHTGARIIDATSLTPTRFIEFGGQPGRLWNWYSTLARLDNTFVVVQTGGGFQETQVMSLDNELLWRFGPNPKLPPTALRPADLDADGETEFYASTTDAVTRLNGKGEPVWRQAAALPHLLQLVPPDGADPAWIVAARHGAAVDIWLPEGKRLAEVKWPSPLVHGVVKWRGTRSLVAGDTSATGVGLDGRRHFEIPIDDPMRLTQAAVWSPAPDSPGLLALVAGGDRELKRWRLRLYASPESLVYDEVFEAPPRLLTAAGSDSTSTLFVVVDGKLFVLRPIPVPSF